MMLIGTGAAAICMFVVALAFTVSPKGRVAGQALVAFLFLYSFFYSGFSAAISWPIAGELVSSRLRILTFSIGTAINYVFSCKWKISRFQYAKAIAKNTF